METAQVRLLTAVIFSLFLATLGAASVKAQPPSPARTETRSPLAEVAHDISNWFSRVTGTDSNRRRESALPAPLLRPLPRPRPTDLTSVPLAPNTEPLKPTTAPVPSNKEPELSAATVPPDKEPSKLTTSPIPSNKEPELTTATISPNKEPSELTAAPVAPKKKAPAPVLIYD
jgi:hypothetical protein